MEPDWPFIGKLAISVVLTSGFATAIVQLFITRRLDRQLEDHKAKLQRENDSASEQLRHELQLRAHVEQVRSAGMLTKRAEVVADVYRRLSELHLAMGLLTKHYSFPGEPSDTERARAAIGALRAFSDAFECNRIFLPVAACAELEKFVTKARDAFNKFTTFGAERSSVGEPGTELKSKLQYEAGTEVAAELPGLRVQVEVEDVFRELLGVTPPTAPAATPAASPAVMPVRAGR